MELAHVVLASENQRDDGRPMVLATITPLIGGGCIGVVNVDSKYEYRMSFRPGVIIVIQMVADRTLDMTSYVVSFGARRPSEAVALLHKLFSDVVFHAPEYQFGSQRTEMQLAIEGSCSSDPTEQQRIYIWGTSTMYVPDPPREVWEQFLEKLRKLDAVEDAQFSTESVIVVRLTEHAASTFEKTLQELIREFPN